MTIMFASAIKNSQPFGIKLIVVLSSICYLKVFQKA